MSSQPRQILHLLRWQGITTLIMLLLAAPFGLATLISVGIGGIACLLGNAFAATLVFRRYRAQQPDALLVRLYVAEVIKISIVLAFFAVSYWIISLVSVNFQVSVNLLVPLTFGSFLVCQMLPTLIPDRHSDPLAQRHG